jgi:DNA-binding MarR family transcriptional regulator
MDDTFGYEDSLHHRRSVGHVSSVTSIIGGMTSAGPPTTPSGAAACAEERCVEGVALDADLGWALGAVFRSYVKIVGVVMDEVPGGPRGYQVLAAAARGEQGTQLALAQQLGIDRTVMTYLIDDIERAQLVERQPDPADRRARRVVATERGHALVAHLQERLRMAEDHVLSALDDAERDQFRHLLRRLATHAAARYPLANACDAVEELDADGPITAPRPRRRPRRTT